MAPTLSLADRLSDRNNALNLVRLFLASAVIFGHAFPVTGAAASQWEGVSRVAVDGFFIVSGYLIAGSRSRTKFLPYLWRRALRIFPAFWVVLIVTALVFGPLAAMEEGASYSIQSAASYVATNAGLYINQWGIDNTLRHVPYPDAWNGSLWTLNYEFLGYLAIGVLLGAAVVRRHAALVLMTLLVVVILLNPLAEGPLDVTTNYYLNGLRLASYFLAGSAAWALRHHWHVRKYQVFAAGLAYVLLVLLDSHMTWGQVPLAVVVLGIGSARYTGWATTNDISYGIYIYAFPVQQMLILQGTAHYGPLINALLTLLITSGFAYLSWRFVEHPALRLKNLAFKRGQIATPSSTTRHHA